MFKEGARKLGTIRAGKHASAEELNDSIETCEVAALADLGGSQTDSQLAMLIGATQAAEDDEIRAREESDAKLAVELSKAPDAAQVEADAKLAMELATPDGTQVEVDDKLAMELAAIPDGTQVEAVGNLAMFLTAIPDDMQVEADGKLAMEMPAIPLPDGKLAMEMPAIPDGTQVEMDGNTTAMGMDEPADSDPYSAVTCLLVDDEDDEFAEDGRGLGALFPYSQDPAVHDSDDDALSDDTVASNLLMASSEAGDGEDDGDAAEAKKAHAERMRYFRNVRNSKRMNEWGRKQVAEWGPMALFDLYRECKGDWSQMQLVSERKSTHATGQTTRRQLWSAKMIEDFYKDKAVTAEIIRCKTAAGEFEDNPDAPGCIAARLYPVWAGTKGIDAKNNTASNTLTGGAPIADLDAKSLEDVFTSKPLELATGVARTPVAPPQAKDAATILAEALGKPADETPTTVPKKKGKGKGQGKGGAKASAKKAPKDEQLAGLHKTMGQRVEEISGVIGNLDTVIADLTDESAEDWDGVMSF